MSTNTSDNPKLLTLLRNSIRMKGYSSSTEKAYVSWVIQFIRWHGIIHPIQLNESHVRDWLYHLVEGFDKPGIFPVFNAGVPIFRDDKAEDGKKNGFAKPSGK